MYLTLLQAANELDRTERQVRYLVKTGIILPINQDTYKRDGGYRFSQDEVERIKEMLKPEGISLRKAAEIVGVTPQYLNSLALKGEIDSDLVLIGNKKERRFKKEECIKFRSQLKVRTHSSVAQFGDKLHLYNHNLRLFDLFSYKDELIRVVKTEPIVFLKTDGTLIHPCFEEFVQWSSSWPEKPYRTKKGFVSFRLPIPRNPEHLTYNILFNLIEELGVKNVQVFEQNDGDYFIRCRQGKISLQQECFNLLKRYLVEGEINKISDDIVELQSSMISQYIHLPRELYTEIEKLASEHSVSIQEQLNEIIVRGVKSFRSDR
ncbi:hypothetical protein BKP35_16200 [Anaerobacillus arseniciselenatis]|uniref:Uncharacterized protein n=1 Tax=Anaerobacillus arseniciselenatis TaxID=85682 RepID=A0A1S2LA75_9BACI|nr:hypothetical protein [Anaerobacillus arseniciselenatis]OIJ09398.1 hypothetical protein BKP35_16200 [Anaerobacillus arseniciselenatis]